MGIAMRTMISGGRCRCLFVTMGVAMGVGLCSGRRSRGSTMTVVGRCGLGSAVSLRRSAMRVCLSGDRGTGSSSILDADALGRWCSRCRPSRGRGIVSSVMAGIMRGTGSMGRRLAMRWCVSVHCRRRLALGSVLAGLGLLRLGLFGRLGLGRISSVRIGLGCIGLGRIWLCCIGFRCIRFCRFSFCSFGLGRRRVRVMAAAMVIMLRIGCHGQTAGKYQCEHGKWVNVHDGCPLH